MPVGFWVRHQTLKAWNHHSVVFDSKMSESIENLNTCHHRGGLSLFPEMGINISFRKNKYNIGISLKQVLLTPTTDRNIACFNVKVEVHLFMIGCHGGIHGWGFT